MGKVIIYKSDDGVAVVHPTAEALAQMPIESIARLSVPHGQPFGIVDAGTIPTDRALRDAWTVDASLLIDGVGEA